MYIRERVPMASSANVGRALGDSLNPLGELNRQSITKIVVPENLPIQRFECSEEARQRIQVATGAVVLQVQIRAREDQQQKVN